MPCTMPYWKSVLIATDQWFNALFGGWSDETLSSHAYRLSVKGIRHWPRKVIDNLFFWDRDKATGKRHCELSFDSEREGRQLPPECRANPRLGLKHKARE